MLRATTSGKPYSLRIEIPILPSTQADVMQQKVRWAYRKKWHKRIADEIMIQHARPKELLTRVGIHGIRFSSVQPDRINLWYSWKPLIDACIGVIFVDDSPKYILDEKYTWERAAPKEGRVLLLIREIPPAGEGLLTL